MAKPTIKELESKIDAMQRESVDLQREYLAKRLDLEKQLAAESSKARRFETDHDRIKTVLEGRNVTEGFVKAAIASRLASNFGMTVEPRTEWFRGEQIEEAGVTEEVRFLRHLVKMIDSSMPF